jgi:cephalosporin hydroxylase
MMAVKRLLKRIAYCVAPRWAPELNDYWWLLKRAQELARRTADFDSPVDFFAALRENGCFPANQKPAEILRLMEIVGELRPHRALEIGTQNGGTLFLLASMCAPDAELVSIDISYNRIKRYSFPRLGRKQQRIVCLQADSHAPATRQRVERQLADQKLDFLFIDGDHTFEGVAADFQLFAPLVRPGGIIAFHDIIPDFQTRYGIATGNWTGEVPRFWSEIRRGYEAEEIIEDTESDGYGIGVIHWQGGRP